MNKVYKISRYLLAIIYIVFGLNGFFQFIPVPAMPEKAQQFMGALIASGYMLFWWKAFEVIGGVLLLINKFKLFASLILLPISANIFMFHLFLDPKTIVIGIIVLGTNLLLIYENKAFISLLKEKPKS